MVVTMERLEKSRVKLIFDVEASRFEEGMAHSYRKNVARMTLPGFRKGKAPRKLVEQYYGEAVLYDDAFDYLFPSLYKEAIEENKLNPLDRPEVEVDEIGSGKNLQFTAIVSVPPEVTLGQYKGVTITRIPATVDDAAVDARIEQDAEKLIRWVTVEDRPVKEGDRVLLDYSGSVDGELFDGGTDTNATLDIGSGRFIPGFEEQLIGVALNEEKTITVTFPEEYHEETLAGKEAQFDCLVHEIKEKQMPALDDEFAQDVSSFDTFEAYKADVRAKLEKEAQERADARMEDAMIEKVLENCTVDLPDVLVDRQIDTILYDMERNLMASGLNMDIFLQYTGRTIEEMREQNRDLATRRALFSEVMPEIVKAENISVEEEEIDAQIAKEAEEHGEDVEHHKEHADRDMLRKWLETRKAIDLIKQNAIIEEPAQEA